MGEMNSGAASWRSIVMVETREELILQAGGCEW